MSYPAEAGGDDELVSGTMVGEYAIENLLGAGGMGEVYGARHPVIGKRVAIKIMSRHCSANPINVERFVQEAKAVNAIGHANIVDIFSFGKMADGRCFFVMEWLQGKSLRDEIDRGAVTPARALDVLEAVLRALEAAHAAGIVHRDLKPDNIFVVAARDGEPERVKLLDFGIAKLADDGTQIRNNRTKTGTVIGTPSYMAPEQASGAAITGQSDVYSLGVVAFEMATGQPPFDAEAAVQVMAKHVDEEPPRPSSIRPVTIGMERLILEMLAKGPSERPAPAEARQRIARLRIDPGEVTDSKPPEPTAPTAAIKVSIRAGRAKPGEPTARAKPPTTTAEPLALEVEPRADRVGRAATVAATPAVASSGVAIPTTGTVTRARRGWLIVAILGGLGIAAIGVGAYTSGGHGAAAPPVVTAPVVEPAVAAPAPVASTPSTPSTPPAPHAIVAPVPPPPQTIAPVHAHKPASPVAVTVKPAAPAAPPAAVVAPPPKHDVDAVVDPYATGSGGAP